MPYSPRIINQALPG